MAQVVELSKRKQYESEIWFRDSKQPLTLKQAQNKLAEIEARREFRTVDPSRLRVDQGILIDKNREIGALGQQGWVALKHYTGVDGMPDNKETFNKINKALRNWDDEEGNKFQLRIDKVQKRVNGILTDKYIHLPYDRLLNGFPKGYLVPRMQVDARFVQIHVIQPEALFKEKDQLYPSSRILSSDVGLCRFTLLYEILRLICLNGLIRATQEVFYKRYHLLQEGKPVLEADATEQVKALLEHATKVNALEKKRIQHARSAKTTEETASKELTRLGLGNARVRAALEYAKAEFQLPLSRWAVAQGVAYVSQLSRGTTGKPANVLVQNDIDALAAQYASIERRGGGDVVALS